MEYQMITLGEAEDRFNDYIDEATPEIKILGMSYTPSRVLYEVDPIAWRTVFDEFANHLWEDGTAVECYNDDNLTECDECEIYTDDSRGELCKDCDKQADEERGLR